ncbi:MAG: VWA-like domain-containing protein [Haliscomenobacter sp.]|uniref:vWA domain-containing protein n=1 Tax=Haliscomenobacter sp. TaxID=2717303 RepID=UPI0029BE6C9D|nr:VWA-like domain-containing protein [Haliscomenobacter sp.]MDX2066942.1 VWA-like domain-containing protein [Haliscomenobacter sp.]
MQTQQIFDQITQTSIQLILHEPFYGHVLTGLVKELNVEIQSLSLGVNANKTPKLTINPTYWQEELNTPAQRLGALKHEVLHLIFEHLLREQDFANTRLFHMAADLVINQYLSPEQLSPASLTMNLFPELDLQPFRSVDAYYDELTNAWNKTLRRGQIISPNLSALMATGTGPLAGHELWQNEIGSLSAAEKKVLETGIQQIVQQAIQRVGAKGQGNLPGGLQKQLKQLAISHELTLDWRRFLRLFVGAGQRTFLQNTLRKPSRRYSTNPGLRIRNKHKLLIALDTSASIADAEIQAFFQEIQQIWRLGTEIFILECDTQINNAYIYRGTTPAVVAGRGGTHFDVAIHYANQQSDADAVVYFTDGLGPAPSLPCRKPLLWMISGEKKGGNGQWEHLPGRKISM